MSTVNFYKPINILMVEDNPGDVRLTQEALKDATMYINLDVTKDGVEALEYLHRTGVYSTACRPDLILLDLNLPKKNGFEVLEEIKADQRLKRIPVVILTTSKADEDILKAYGLYANCYVTKPVSLEQFLKVVHTIEDFWLTIVKLPIQ
jgi:CheY-like chemotaxis protein